MDRWPTMSFWTITPEWVHPSITTLISIWWCARHGRSSIPLYISTLFRTGADAAGTFTSFFFLLLLLLLVGWISSFRFNLPFCSSRLHILRWIFHDNEGDVDRAMPVLTVQGERPTVEETNVMETRNMTLTANYGCCDLFFWVNVSFLPNENTINIWITPSRLVPSQNKKK